jgi:hypothetical protein
MDKNRFNVEVRPFVIEVRIGKQGVAFDRVDLDEWFDQYKALNGRPGKAIQGSLPREHRSDHGSLKVGGVRVEETSREKREFEKAVEQAISRSRKQR